MIIINKNYYVNLNDKFEIISAEVNHEQVKPEILETIKSAVQKPLIDNKLFGGEHYEQRTKRVPDIRTDKVAEFKIHADLANISVGEGDADGETKEGFIRVVELDKSKMQLRLWIQSADYVKKTQPSADTELDDSGASF